MSLSFLPDGVKAAISHLNYNFLSEIRLRRGQPVIIGYDGAYRYLGRYGISSGVSDRIIADEITPVLNNATGGCIYNYTEQMKSGFITVEHGVRIGIAGEYVTDGGAVNTIKNVTSLNIRIPHEVAGCADKICKSLFNCNPQSTLIFSKPGMGKTTMLRDIARYLTNTTLLNVLVFDERGEIAAMDGFGEGFDLGAVDVVRCFCKKGAIASAIRAMKPDVIITDELYGDEDIKAVKYAADCGITVIASSHITDREILKTMPFRYFVELKSVFGQPLIYDKNFNPYIDSCVDDCARRISCGE